MKPLSEIYLVLDRNLNLPFGPGLLANRLLALSFLVPIRSKFFFILFV